jgi:hypothetical protein
VIEWFCFRSPEGLHMVALRRGDAAVEQLLPASVQRRGWQGLLRVEAHLKGRLRRVSTTRRLRERWRK